MIKIIYFSVRPWLFQEGAGISQGSKNMVPQKYSYNADKCSIPNKIHESLFLYTDLIVGDNNGNMATV